MMISLYFLSTPFALPLVSSRRQNVHHFLFCTVELDEFFRALSLQFRCKQ
jgi:hypothetical protein